jgi:poly(3-hydroxybutyrate) depolymerase
MPSSTVNVVQLGTISNGSGSSARTFSYYIPKNLLHDGSAQGKPAAVFLMDPHSCSTPDASSYLSQSQLAPVADANRFVIIGLKCDPAYTGWNHPQVDCSGSTCGTSTAPSDELYIKTAVAKATAQFNIDPQRRYIIGGSSSGNMVDDILCDKSQTPHNSTLFRGAMQMGGGFNAKLNTANGAVCPGGDKNVFRLLIMGNSAGNTSDPYTTINIPATSPTHTILGFDDSRAWWSNYLGCSAPVHTTTGSVVLSDVYSYSGCSNTVSAASPFFEAVGVKNGGHMFCQLDTSPAQPVCANLSPSRTSNNTGGWNTAQFTWNFFANTKTTVASAPTSSLPGDLNNDGTVNVQDLSILLSDYNSSNAAADINGDGTVNILDLSALLSHFGQSGSTAGPPTVSLSASPSSISAGQSSTITWSSTNAASCTASGAWSGSRSTSGSQTVSPTATSSYGLSCTGSGGTAAATNATVSVSAGGGTLTFQATFNSGTIAPFNQWACAGHNPTSPIETLGPFAFGQPGGEGAYYGDYSVPADTSVKQRCQTTQTQNDITRFNTTEYYGLMLWVPANWNPPVPSWGPTIAELNYQTTLTNNSGKALELNVQADHVTIQMATGLMNVGGAVFPNQSNADEATQIAKCSGVFKTKGYCAIYAIPPGKLVKGAWNEIIVGDYFTTCANVTPCNGWVKAWYRAKGQTNWSQSADVSGIPTLLYDSTHDGSGQSLDAIGLYRGPANVPIEVGLDNFTRATSFSAVAATLP